MTELSESSRKELLAQFVSSEYDISQEEAYDCIDLSNVPDNPQDLPFVSSRKVRNSTNAITVDPELIARAEYVNDLISLNIDYVPESRDGYIEQLVVPEEEEFHVRENPNLVVSEYISEGDMTELFEKIEDEIDTMETLVDDIENEELKTQFFVSFAMMRYAIDKKNTTHLQNAHRTLRFMTSRPSIDKNRRDLVYHKIGHKLEFVFDTDDLPDVLHPYYTGDVTSLVRVVEKCLAET